MHIFPSKHSQSCSSIAALPQVNHLMLRIRVQVHVPTQLIHPTVAARMEAPVGALLHMLQPVWRGEPEDATLLPAVCWRHHYRHGLLQHGLVAALRVDVDRAEEAGLCGVRVDPAQRHQLTGRLAGQAGKDSRSSTAAHDSRKVRGQMNKNTGKTHQQQCLSRRLAGQADKNSRRSTAARCSSMNSRRSGRQMNKHTGKTHHSNACQGTPLDVCEDNTSVLLPKAIGARMCCHGPGQTSIQRSKMQQASHLHPARPPPF